MESSEDTLIYSLNTEEDCHIDYRNSNYKEILFDISDFMGGNKEENNDKKYVKLKQNNKLGKGGIFWDGVRYLIIQVLYYIVSLIR